MIIFLCILSIYKISNFYFIFFYSRQGHAESEGRGGKKKRRKEGKEEGTLLLQIHAMSRGQTHNSGLGPDQESKRQPFSAQNAAEPTEPLWPDRILTLLFLLLHCCFLALATCFWRHGLGIHMAHDSSWKPKITQPGAGMAYANGQQTVA